MNDFQTQIYKTIDILTGQKLKGLGFDISKRGKVISVNSNVAIVQIDGENYTCKLRRGINVIPNDIVYVKFPQNNDHDKYIETILGLNEVAETIEITAEEILAKLKTVDGAGSGIDADLLDGKHGSEYALKEDIAGISIDGDTIIQNINSSTSIIDDKNLSSNVKDKYTKTEIDTKLNTKVDKVAGKQLSTEDYTTDMKNKLINIEDGAEKNKVNSVNSKTGDVVINKTDMNLGNVENKSSATIRSEITNTNVTNALGYTPENSSNKGVANGYAPLDSNVKIPLSILPDIAKQQTYVVELVADRDSLTGIIMGEKCYVTGTGDSYIWDGSKWVTLAKADWENVNLQWTNIVGKPNSNVSDIDNAVSVRHSHSNKSLIDTITQTLIDRWNAAWTHISDTIKHITAGERNKWNTVDNKADTIYVNTELNKKSDKSHLHTELDISDLDKYTKAETDTKLSGKVDNSRVLTDVPHNAKFTDTIYTLPVASSAILGGIKIGANLTISEDGTLSAIDSDERSNFIIKQEIFVATEGQTLFNLTKGNYQPNTNTIAVYLYGGKQPNIILNEISTSSFEITEHLNEGDVLIVEYFELSSATPYPIHGIDHLTGGYDAIPKVTTTSDGLMAKEDKSKLAGIEQGANKYVHPSTHSLDMITETSTKKILTSDERSKISEIDNKVDKVDGKGLSTNDYTTVEKNKLAGISAGAEVNQNAFSNIKIGTSTISANNKIDTIELIAGTGITLTPDAVNDKLTISGVNQYEHPETHPANMIVESSTKQFVSDSEKSTWNTVSNKVDKVIGKGLSTEDFTTTEKSKLENIDENANNYTHPVSHPPSIIAQNSNNRFTTDTEKSKWNTVDNKVDKVAGKQLSTEDFTTTEKSKLSSIATGATKNDTDTNLKNRANHTGTQTSSTISDFSSAVKSTVLSGLSTATSGLITTSDTILSALGKIQKQISDNLSTLTNHINNKSNPHSVTKTQIGLSNVDNTSDLNKPISTATQTALNGKVDNSRVLTDVPSGAKFTDTVTIINGKTGEISKADIVALGIPAQDTIYTHPSTHPASMIAESTSRRFVSDTEKATWNNKAEISDIPTKVSELTNDSNYVTQSELGDAGFGDMVKVVYDTNNNGIVDNAEKVNGFTVETNVPANAKFTDTTYGVATTSSSGLMSSTDKTNLDNNTAARHIHSNKSAIDKFTEVDNKPYYNGEEIGGAVPNLTLTELTLGSRFKIVYNDIEDSLDIEVI